MWQRQSGYTAKDEGVHRVSSEDAPPERVIVAHTDAELRMSAASLLRDAGYEVIAVGDAPSAKALLLSTPPALLMVADVALTNPPFYQLCTFIKERALGTKVLIVSSVHTHGAYKRAPTNLYGADGFVEEHKLSAELVDKVRATLTS